MQEAADKLFQELQDDWKAIDEDTENDETAKEVLKQERQINYFAALRALGDSLVNSTISAGARSASISGISAVSAQPTIVVQSKTNFKLESMSQPHIHKFAEQAMDYFTSTGGHWSAPQIRSYTSSEQRLEIANTFGVYVSEDGSEIQDAEIWTDWGDNEKLALLLKAAFPKSAAPTDQQKILSAHFDIQCIKTSRHVGKFVADLQVALNWEERRAELNSLPSNVFQNLYDPLVYKVIGKDATCKVTAEFINKVHAKNPSNMQQLLVGNLASIKTFIRWAG